MLLFSLGGPLKLPPPFDPSPTTLWSPGWTSCPRALHAESWLLWVTVTCPVAFICRILSHVSYFVISVCVWSHPNPPSQSCCLAAVNEALCLYIPVSQRHHCSALHHPMDEHHKACWRGKEDVGLAGCRQWMQEKESQTGQRIRVINQPILSWSLERMCGKLMNAISGACTDTWRAETSASAALGHYGRKRYTQNMYFIAQSIKTTH